MSKCAICGKNLLTGDIHWAIGLCNTCYDKTCKSEEQKYIDMLHKESGELLVDSLAKKDKQISELKKQLEQSEKMNKRLYNENESAEKILRMSSNEQTKEILELKKQLEEKEKEIETKNIINNLYKTTMSLRDGDFKDLVYENNSLKQQLKSQPAEIVEKIKAYYEAPIYNKPEAHTKVSFLFSRLDIILKEYQK